MKKVYLDMNAVEKENGCIGVFVLDAEVISVGTTVCSMPVSEKNSEYERYAYEYDMHFIFDDNVPDIPFYTVPWIDIMAVDSDGGYIGMIGQSCDLKSDAPICYIDREKTCYLVAKNGAEFLEKVSVWKEHLEPYEDVKFYRSKEDAGKDLEFVDIHHGE